MRTKKFISIVSILLLSNSICAWAETPPPPKPDITVIKNENIEKPVVVNPIAHTKSYLKKSLNYSQISPEVVFRYEDMDHNIWENYFKRQTKLITKAWKKQTILKNPKYNTSYARVLVYLNQDGCLKFYDIKSSCIPKDDTEFMKTVEESVLWKLKLEKLPSEYKNSIIAFTIKFHTKLPNSISAKNIEWNRYGIADIEVGKEKSTLYIKESVLR